ncbi:TRAFAC clade GTPase domain-containing protein [Mycobacterium sp. NPDC050041]|uniref:TRAFAC clade GTPase domain-containing protein n=1 Tax=Mycobacterium sp. NPDC050041 TaxID=3364293 RepID=UPI003C2C3610
MPSTFGHAKSPMFGMVGVKGSGKTVYLTVLIHELKSSVRRRFGASVRSLGESPMNAAVEQIRETINSGGVLPPSTAQAGDVRQYPIVLEWQVEKDGFLGRSSVSSTILSFYDTAGEDLNTQNTTSSLAYLAAADGLIVLLDPFQFPENTRRGLSLGIDGDALDRPAIDVMSRITELLRSADSVKVGRKIDRPLAVVVSKIDAFFNDVPPDHAIRKAPSKLPLFDEAESADLHNHVEALVDSWGGDDVLSLLRTNFSKYRFFAMSALGAPPDYQTARADSQGLRPHRVAEPLLWLMANDKIIEKQD